MSILKRYIYIYIYISQRDVFYQKTTYLYSDIYFDKYLCDRKAVRYSVDVHLLSLTIAVVWRWPTGKCRKHGASCHILTKEHLYRLSERLTQADLMITAMYLCTGLGLPPDYLGSRALTELQPPPSTIGSSEFPFSIDGEYLTVCLLLQTDCIKKNVLWSLLILRIIDVKETGREGVMWFHLAKVRTWRRFPFKPLKPELNPICYLLALLGPHHFLHVSRIRVKLLTLRLLMSYIYGAPILDVSRSHTTTQYSR